MTTLEALRKFLGIEEERYNEYDECFVLGADAENTRIRAIEPQLLKCVEALERMGKQCVNTGMYGPMGIRPGECTCSSCDAKHALAELRAAILK